MTEKPKPDWEKIEQDYRAGVLSLREIASPYSVSEGAIRKRAKRDEWVRDLAKKIESKADELVRNKMVRTEVRSEQIISERVLIDANAEVIANVRLSHRHDISKSRTLVMSLLSELEIETMDIELFRDLGELMRSEDDKGQDRLNDLYNKVIGLPSRVKTMKDLADALKALIGLEREAYGIAGEPQKVELNHTGSMTKPKDPIEASKAYADLMQGN